MKAELGRAGPRNDARRRVRVPLPALAFCGAALVALADQATKEIIRGSLSYGEVIPVTGFFNIVFHMNPGAAFGMLASSGWQGQALLGFGVLAIVVLSVILLRTRTDRWLAAGLSAILGGAAGNVIDRVRHRAVVDWLDFHVAGWHWPAFNLADTALTLGVAAFVLADLIGKRRPSAKTARQG
jgi:signal peptidase II